MTHSSTRTSALLACSLEAVAAVLGHPRGIAPRALALLAAIFLLLGGMTPARAASGIFNGFVILNTAGNANQYDLNGTTQNTQTALFDFNGTNLGSYGGTQNLTLKGGEAQTFKNGGCDVTNAKVWYRVYPAGSPSGAFSSLNLAFGCNEFDAGCGIPNTAGNQKWYDNSHSVNLLNGLVTSGLYTVEVYLTSDFNNCSFGTNYWTDGGANYKANFYYATFCGLNYTIDPSQPASGTNFQSFTSAIAALNSYGVTCPTTFNVAAGSTYTETPPAITATGTAANPIIFQKSGAGANPKITAAVGTGGTSAPDAIVRLSGSDYLTFDGIDLLDPTSNASQTTAMEIGYGLFRASGTNGCQNVTIKNCAVTLQRTFNGTSGFYDFPIGIAGTNTGINSATGITITSTAGANSNNKFYANTIQNVSTGVGLVGMAGTTASLYDTGNDIGGTAAGTGNTIRNVGGAATTTYVIKLIVQNGVNVQYNTIDNAGGTGGTPATATFYDVFTAAGSPAATLTTACTYSNNSFTLSAAAGSSFLAGIYNQIASTGGLTISGNTISHTLSATVASSSPRYLVYNIGSASELTLNANNLSLSLTSAAAGADLGGAANGIYQNGAISGPVTMTNNQFSGTLAATAAGAVTTSLFGIYSTGTTGGAATYRGNTSNIALASSAASTFGASATPLTPTGIYAAGTMSSRLAVKNNTVSITAGTSGTPLTAGTLYLASRGILTSGTVATTDSVSNNTVTLTTVTAGTASLPLGNSNTLNMAIYHATPAVGGVTLSGNTINLNLTSGASNPLASFYYYGVANFVTLASALTVSNNTVTATGTAGASALSTGIFGIYNLSPAPSVTVSGNTISIGLTSTAGTGALSGSDFGIYQSNLATISGTYTVTNNQITGSLTGNSTAGITNQLYGIYALGTAASTVVTNNAPISLTFTSTGAGTFGTSVASITPNGLYILGSPGNLTVSGNSVAITESASAGTLYISANGIQTAGSGSSVASLSGNDVTISATCSGTGTMPTGNNNGILNGAPATNGVTMDNNTVTLGLSNSAATGIIGAAFNGVRNSVTLGASAPLSLQNNKVSPTLTCSAGSITGTVCGVLQGSPLGSSAIFSSGASTPTAFVVNNSGSGTITGGLFGIYSGGAIAGAASFTTNTISFAATQSSSAALSSSMVGIYNTGALNSSASFNSNPISFTIGLTGAGAVSGAMAGISTLTGTIAGAATFNGNTISFAPTQSGSGALSSAMTGIGNAAPLSATVSFNANSIGFAQAITAGTSSITGALIGIGTTATGTMAGAAQFSANAFTLSATKTGGTITSDYSAISNLGATASTLVYDANTLLNFSSASTGRLRFLFNDATSTGLLTMSNNQFGGTGTTTATSASTGICYGYYVGGATPTTPNVLVQNNTMSRISWTGGSSDLFGYYNGMTGAATGTATVTGNTVADLSVSGARQFFAFWHSGSSNQALILTNNTLNSGISLGTGAGTGITLSSGNTKTPVISGNQIGLTAASSALLGISVSSATTSLDIASNTVTLSSGNTATSTGISFGVTVPTTINANTITGVASAGFSMGIYTGSSSTNDIYSNTISGITSSTTSISTPSAIGIRAALGSVNTIYQNTISGVNCTGATGSTLAIGIQIAGGNAGSTAALYRNKVTDMTSSSNAGRVYGLHLGSSNVACTVYNNIVGDLKAPNANSHIAISGIFAEFGTTIGLYYNTVGLSATSTGAAFGTSGIAFAAGPAVTLKNNVVVNKSTPNGNAATVALRRTATGTTGTAPATTNLASATDYNLYYVGVPAVNRLIYAEGIGNLASLTNPAQQLYVYQALVDSRESNSYTEDVPFQAVTSSNANFLHIATGMPTRVESGGTPIAAPSITDDFDGQTRNATTPDLGADEGAFTPIQFDPQLLNFTAPATTGCFQTTPQTVTVTVKNAGPTAINLTATPITVGGVVSFNLGMPTALGAPVTVPGTTLAAGATVSVTLTTTYNMSAVGTYYFIATVSGGGDQYAGNNTALTVRTVVPPPVVVTSASPATICNGSTSALTAQAGGVNATTYTPTSATYAAYAPGAATVTTLDATSTFSGGTANDGYLTVTLPFTFNFFGSPFTTTHIGTNGYLSFGAGYTVATAASIPSASTPNYMIASDFRDLSVATGGAITYYTLGTTPNRTFVVSYEAVPSNPAADFTTFQIALHELTNTIDIVSTAIPSRNDHVQGIENNSGTLGFLPATYGSTGTTWSATNVKYTFAPGGPFAYNWTLVSGNGLPGTTNTANITVSPTQTSTYQVTASTSGSCDATATVQVKVPALSALTVTNITTCFGAATGQIAASVTDATGNYTFELSNNNGATYTAAPGVTQAGASYTFTGLPAGTAYKVRVTDNGTGAGCPLVSGTLTITEPTAVTAAPTFTNTCAGGSSGTITVNAAGGTPGYSYSLDNGATFPHATSPITGLAAGTYHLIVKDANNCLSSATSVTVSSTMSVTFTGAVNPTDWYTAGNWSPACVPSALVSAVIPAGFNVQITTGTAAVLDLDIQGASTLSVTGGLDIYGTFTTVGIGSYTATAGTTRFLNNGVQAIPAATFFTLAVSGTAPKILAGAPSVTRTLDLTAGSIDLANFNLTMADPAVGPLTTITGADATHYLLISGLGKLVFARTGSGPNTRSTVTFPIGTSLSYSPAVLTFSTSTTYVNASSANVIDGMPAGAPAHVVNKTWDVSWGAGTLPAGATASLQLQWNTSDEGLLFDRTKSSVVHFENGVWTHRVRDYAPAQVAGNGLWARTRTQLTSFSPFAVQDDAEPLPVALVRFEAVAQGTNALLTWATASEKDSRGFEVQVSLDGTEFHALGFVASATPNSTMVRSYEFVDREAGKAGVRFYRLVQQDLDGTRTTSDVRTVRFEGKTTTTVIASPNPFSAQLTVEVVAQAAGTAQLTLVDALGRVVVTQTLAVAKGLNGLTPVLPAHLAVGTYTLVTTVDGQRFRARLVKQ